MNKLLWVFIFFLVSRYACSNAFGEIPSPKFSSYPAQIFHGKTKPPTYYEKIGADWYDDMGKAVAAPEVNFAGKYHIGVHSCGTGCRYYTLSNLVSGVDSDALNMFSTNGRRLITSDGRSYVTNLISRADSKMLVAQYHIERSVALKAECRERNFSLSDDGKEVTPVTKTIGHCKEFH